MLGRAGYWVMEREDVTDMQRVKVYQSMFSTKILLITGLIDSGLTLTGDLPPLLVGILLPPVELGIYETL